ncbi:MAG: hypothetical protein VB115_03995 [Christensenellaceae bacterium]|nr:hypothetical protein [Christensenellaceae bacterium]
MKNLMKKLLTLAMIAALLIAPMAALAEAEGHSLTVGNLHYAIDELTGDIGASVRTTTGELAGRKYIEFSAEGETPIGAVRAAMDDEGLQLWLAGLTNRYGLTWAELEEMAHDSAAVDVPVDFDIQAFQGMTQSAFEMTRQLSDPEAQPKLKAEMEKVMEPYLAGAGQGDMDQAMVMDEAMTLPKFRFTADMALLDQIIGAYGRVAPAYKAYFEQYFKLLSSVEGGEMFKGMTSFAELMEKTGVKATFDVTLWAAEDESAVRAEIATKIDAPEGQKTERIELPVLIEVRRGEDAERVRVTMHAGIEGGEVSYELDADDRPDRQVFKLDMAVTAPDEAPVGIHMNGERTLSPDGQEALTGEFTVAAQGGTPLSARLGYQGTLKEAEGAFERAGRVSLTLAIDAPDVPKHMELAFDIAQQAGPAGEAILSEMDALPLLKLTELTEEQMQALITEAQVTGMNALGALLQTPGVAELISALAAAVEEGPLGGYETPQFEGGDGDYETPKFEGEAADGYETPQLESDTTRT